MPSNQTESPKVPPNWPDYELIDFGRVASGAARKLERFGELLVDRPSPAAEHEQAKSPNAWKKAAARYTGARVGDGKWRPAKGLQPSAGIEVPLGGDLSFTMALEFSPAGQVGLFPEQFENWQWIAERVRRAAVAGSPPSPPTSDQSAPQARQAAVAGQPPSPSPSPPGGGETRTLRVLNLFAYTGGSTLAAAIAGAEVTHVDASKPSVTLARSNAEQSGLVDAPIRWIVEDAVRYCQREVKRGNHYDAVILDPPTYGHGPKGEEWRLTRDLPKLLPLVAELTDGRPSFLLVTCHTPGVGPAELGAYLADGVFGSCAQPPNTGELFLVTKDGRRLPGGVSARWPR